MPPELVWDYLVQPEFRKILVDSDRQVIHNRINGRLAPGSVYQCFHGDKINTQTILEWQPFKRMLTQDLIEISVPFSAGTSVMVDYRLEPIETGTCLTQSFYKAKGPWLGRSIANIVLSTMKKPGQIDIEEFKQRIEADLAERGGISPPRAVISAEDIRQAVITSLSG
jgi:hypothetical protein